jgi:uncharacterized membrane protein
MILYNTLMGVSAGLALILVPLLARALYQRKQIATEGWALTFGILGAALTFLSGAMAVTWPLTANPPINIIFSEPNLVLGLLLLAAAFFLWRKRDTKLDVAYLTRVLKPVSWLLGALGLVLLACTFAIVRFNLVGSAPAQEPITGLLHDYPVVENTFFALLYGLSAVATLLAPVAVYKPESKWARVMGICMVTAGVLFLLFSVMNYYTHIGLLVNLQNGTNIPY